MDFVVERPLTQFPGGEPALLRTLGEMVARLQATAPFPGVMEDFGAPTRSTRAPAFRSWHLPEGEFSSTRPRPGWGTPARRASRPPRGWRVRVQRPWQHVDRGRVRKGDGIAEPSLQRSRRSSCRGRRRVPNLRQRVQGWRSRGLGRVAESVRTPDVAEAGEFADGNAGVEHTKGNGRASHRWRRHHDTRAGAVFVEPVRGGRARMVPGKLADREHSENDAVRSEDRLQPAGGTNDRDLDRDPSDEHWSDGDLRHGCPSRTAQCSEDTRSGESGRSLRRPRGRRVRATAKVGARPPLRGCRRRQSA